MATTSRTAKRQNHKRKREEYESDSSEDEFYKLQTKRVVSEKRYLTLRVEDSVGFTTDLKSVIRCVHPCTSSGPDLKADINQSLTDRYQRSVHVELDGTGFPFRYCFYDKGDLDKISECDLLPFEVKFDKEFALPLFKRCNERWTDLSEEGRVRLHRLLHLPVSMAGRLQFLGKAAGWKKSTEVITPVFNYLKAYGAQNTEGNVMDLLSKGKNTDQMEPLDDLALLGDWISALVCGMADGEALTALYDLLSQVSGLLPHLGIGVPVVIYRVTPMAESEVDAVSILSSSSSETAPASKGLDEGKSGRQLDVDLAVAASDDATHFSKYLTLIKIRDTGKTREQTEAKFLTEMISVLQSQNAIFGFLFGRERAVLYHTKRKPSGKILAYKFEYPLRGQSVIPSSSLSIAHFQLLILDILSSLIYGIEKIRV